MKQPSVALMALLAAGVLTLPQPRALPMPDVITPPHKRTERHWAKLNRAKAKRAEKAAKRLAIANKQLLAKKNVKIHTPLKGAIYFSDARLQAIGDKLNHAVYVGDQSDAAVVDAALRWADAGKPYSEDWV